LNPIALKYAVNKDRLVIKPRPALARLCRRATWDELATIEMLYGNPWSGELAKSLSFRFQGMPSADTKANGRRILDLAESIGTGSAAEVLEDACLQYGWCWHPDGKDIAVTPKTQQIERQLSQLVSVEYSGIQLRDVLLDLVGKSGTMLKMDPGVLASLPVHQTQRFKLSLQNVSIRQALELIAGETGLGYFIEPDGVRITANPYANPETEDTEEREATAQATVAALRADPLVGTINIPGKDGTSYSFFIRASDLPDKVNALRQARIQEAADQIQKALQATQPGE